MQQLLRRDLRRRGRQGAWTPQQGAEPIKRRDQWAVAEALADCYELPPLQGRNDSEQRFDHDARVLSASHYGQKNLHLNRPCMNTRDGSQAVLRAQHFATTRRAPATAQKWVGGDIQAALATMPSTPLFNCPATRHMA